MTDWLHRVPAGYREPIGVALELIAPLNIAPPRFLCGNSPIFVGLHEHDLTTERTGVSDEEMQERGLSYEVLAHYCSPHHLEHLPASQRAATIVLPDHLDRPHDQLVETILHELGHFVHETTGWGLEVPETTEYSNVSWWERFAEAFMLQYSPWTPGEWKASLLAEEYRPFRQTLGLV